MGTSLVVIWFPCQRAKQLRRSIATRRLAKEYKRKMSMWDELGHITLGIGRWRTDNLAVLGLSNGVVVRGGDGIVRCIWLKKDRIIFMIFLDPHLGGLVGVGSSNKNHHGLQPRIHRLLLRYSGLLSVYTIISGYTL